MSPDGMVVALGSTTTNYAKIVTADDTDKIVYTERYDIMDGFGNGGQFSNGMALSADGSRLVIGEPMWNNSKGKVLIYNIHNSSEKLIASVAGSTSNTMLGYSVAMSSDGNRVAFGIPHASSKKGRTRVYEVATQY